MGKTYKSFSQLKEAMFDTFLKMNLKEKERFLKENDIVMDSEYVGVYNAKKNAVRIETLRNPFTGDVMEGKVIGHLDIPNKQRVSVKLRVGRVDGECRSPETVFGFQCEGVVVDKDYLERILGETKCNALKFENELKEQKSRNSQINKTLEGKENEIAKLQNTIVHLENDIARQKTYSIELNNKMNALKSACKSAEQERLRIANILKERKIEELLHVTQIENLPSILKNGILPIDKGFYLAATNDNSRKDGMLDCTSLSISRINSFYIKKLHRDDKNKVFVCIYINPVILLDSNKKYYCHYNAAATSISDLTNSGRLTTSRDLDYMFAETIEFYTVARGHESRHRVKDAPINYTTNEQAEILYRGDIDPTFILYIGFPSEEMLYKNKDLLENYNIKGKVIKELSFR